MIVGDNTLFMQQQGLVPSGGTFTQVGNTLSFAGFSTPTITGMTSARVALLGGFPNDTVNSYDFDGTNFALVGTGVKPFNGVGLPALSSSSGTRITFMGDSDEKLRAMDYITSTWSNVGTPLTVSGSARAVMGGLTSSLTVHWDSSNQLLRAYTFNGTTWSQQGNSLSVTTAGSDGAIGIMSATRFAFVDGGNDELRAYDFDGTNFSLVGSGFSVPAGTRPALTGLSSTKVVIAGDGAATMRVVEFNGSTWSYVGSGFSLGTVQYPSLATMTATRVALIDNTNKLLTAYDLT